MDQPIARDHAQVVGPGAFNRADQLGVDHLAIQLLLGDAVEIAERPDLTGLAQAQRGIRDPRFRSRPAWRRARGPMLRRSRSRSASPLLPPPLPCRFRRCRSRCRRCCHCRSRRRCRRRSRRHCHRHSRHCRSHRRCHSHRHSRCRCHSRSRHRSHRHSRSRCRHHSRRRCRSHSRRRCRSPLPFPPPLPPPFRPRYRRRCRRRCRRHFRRHCHRRRHSLAIGKGGGGSDDAGDDLGSGEPAGKQQRQRGGPVSQGLAARGHGRSFADRDAINTRWDGSRFIWLRRLGVARSPCRPAARSVPADGRTGRRSCRRHRSESATRSTRS